MLFLVVSFYYTLFPWHEHCIILWKRQVVLCCGFDENSRCVECNLEKKSVYLLMFPSQDFMWDKNLLSADNLTELQKVPPVRDV